MDCIVAIKDLSEDFNVEQMLKKEKAELKTMMLLDHRNVAVFHGLLNDEDRYFLLQEYGVRGSLRDILNSKIQLTWEVKRSLCNDIVDGMAYIHQHFGHHGSLNTTACIITGRMEVKIGNYGIQRIRAKSRAERRNEVYMEELMLWEAPEILKNPAASDISVLQKADVYSYAIIAHEVYYVKGPFWLGPDCIPNNENLLDNIKAGTQDIYGHFTRPFVPNNEYDHCRLCNVQLASDIQYQQSREGINVVIKCWAQNPSLRPAFNRIKKMRAQVMRNNIVDDLILRLKEYTDKLEQEVDRKTKHITDEKEKANELINTLLPQTVADELKEGLPSVPFEYSAVTIYQSDIEGFTSIGTKSEPIQILNMLRNMYKIFDELIATYDAFKVETIGDAYVAVSGAPVINDNHGSQICLFALQIQNEIDQFKISHLPNEKLRIRIGIHSGPVVGGVVGQSVSTFS